MDSNLHAAAYKAAALPIGATVAGRLLLGLVFIDRGHNDIQHFGMADKPPKALAQPAADTRNGFICHDGCSL